MELNFVAIIASTLIGMGLGAVWYSPVLFGNAWMKALGKTEESLGDPKGAMIGAVCASLMTAIGIALLFSLTGISDITSALKLALLLGVLIVFPALWSDNLFCGWGNQLLFIQAGYRVVTVVLMCVVMYFLS